MGKRILGVITLLAGLALTVLTAVALAFDIPSPGQKYTFSGTSPSPRDRPERNLLPQQETKEGSERR